MQNKKILNEINELVGKQTDTKSSTKTNKAKGRRLQNWMAEKIREITQLPKTDVAPAVMGESGMDIKLSQKARELFPYAVECKNVERLNIWKAIEQAEYNARTEKLKPLVVFKRNNTDKFVVLKATDFLELLQNKEDHNV